MNTANGTNLDDEFDVQNFRKKTVSNSTRILETNICLKFNLNLKLVINLSVNGVQQAWPHVSSILVGLFLHTTPTINQLYNGYLLINSMHRNII